MKTHLICILSILAAACLNAHEGVELGPNGGRILEFSKDESIHGEVTLGDGSFKVALLDREMKPLALSGQSLVAITGDRSKPVKLEVTKTAAGFSLPAVNPGDWLILQYKNSPEAKAVTARMEFNRNICEECKAEEWLCACRPEKEKK